MNYNLFERKGIIYKPVHWLAWWILCIFAGFAVYIFIDIDRNSHSLSDTLTNFAFNLLVVALCYSLVGFVFSRRKSEADQ